MTMTFSDAFLPGSLRQMGGTELLADAMMAYDPFPRVIASQPNRRAAAQRISNFRRSRQESRRREEEQAAQMAADMSGDMSGEMAAGNMESMEANQGPRRAPVRRLYIQAIGARFDAAINSPAPFAERLVHFWSNHFAVSADNIQIIGLAGAYEFEAIRPNIFGSFADMLLDVERHPAMLLYLDQSQSIGPNSRFGQRRRQRGNARGLNENLAREILELHTMGVRSGYSQDDVLELAKALTGHSVVGYRQRGRDTGEAGDYVFREQAHEPGTRTVMGNQYRDDGPDQALHILRDLAMAPATATHISTKLARHFVADEPPAALVERMAQAYLANDGQLAPVYDVLLSSPEMRDPAHTKFLDPWSWMVSVARTVGATQAPEGRQLYNVLNQLGQPTWKPGSPAGFGDDRDTWLGPDTLLRRIEATPRLLALGDPNADVRELAASLMGDRLTSDTRQAIARAENARQAMSLFVLSPEYLFQ